MTEKEKRQVCRLVAGLVTSDEDFDDSERAFIDKMLVGFSIPEEEWDAIFPLVDADDAADAIAKLPGEVQAEAFELLVAAAHADGRIADEEREYLRIVGGGMGLAQKEIDARLNG